MADVFVSYKSDDRARVQVLVDALRRQGLSVWWDQDIPPTAPWEASIQQAIERAKCMIVCWTELSIGHESGAKVQVEAREAYARKKLIQVKLQPVPAPLFFRQWQSVDLTGWTENDHDPRLQRLVQAARDMVAGRQTMEALALSLRPAAKPRRSSLLVPLGALLGLLMLWLIFVWVRSGIGTDIGTYVCTLRNPDSICIEESEIAGFEAALVEAKARLAQKAIFNITDLSQNFPTLPWALAQLAAPTAPQLGAYRDSYRDRMAGLIDPACGCYLHTVTPHTITNAWSLIASAYFGEAAPASVLDALLRGQSVAGWWSAPLDAQPLEENASIYVTAFVILALQHQIDLGVANPDQVADMQKAIDRGAIWLVNETARETEMLKDYPHAARGTVAPGIEGAVLAALSIARPDLDFNDRARRLSRKLGALPDLWTMVSSDVLVKRSNGQQFYDDIRHISAAWMLFGGASSFRQLEAVERVIVIRAVRRVFAQDIASAELFEREWVAAEVIFVLNETVERLYELKGTPSGHPGGGIHSSDMAP